MVMPHSSFERRRRQEALNGVDLAQHQLTRLNSLLEKILPQNEFYAEKLAGISRPLDSLDDLAQLPFTYKEELIGSRTDADWAANHTYPREDYARFHRTSGTRGRPMVVLDTEEDWQWWIDTWQFVLDAAEVTAGDRAMLAFSFGPYVGFWSAFDALVERGTLAIPSGGMSTNTRLDLLRDSQATLLLCTPTYALHMAEVAQQRDLDVARLGIRSIIVAGEPGGSVPAIRERIEGLWDAKVIDYVGATEVGPWGYGDANGQGMHIVESEFIAEFLSVEDGKLASEGELSELVITTLGRPGCPLIRYRTGDLVRPSWNVDSSNRFVFLEGGILSRADDMMIIRGVNIYPSSIEQILRSFPEIVEYRMTAHKLGEMDALTVEIEDRLGDPGRVVAELQKRLSLKVEVVQVDLGSLPRYEGRGKRFVDER